MKDSPKRAKHIAYITYALYTKHKKTAINAVKSILFVFILGMLILGVGNMLAVPQSMINEKNGMRDIHKYPNSYDVCIIGRSTAICNFSCQELYEQYGIAGVSAGISNQSFPMTLYTLEEILKYQSPQVVILDSRALFESTQAELRTLQDEAYLHYTLDDIKTTSIKTKALEKIQTVNDELDVWDYYSKFYYAHENWKTISERNFAYYDSTAVDAMHGNIAYLNIADNVSNTYASSTPYSAAIITRQIQQYVADAIELCRRHGADLMLMTSYFQYTKPQHNAVVRLANKYHIKYIDINNFILKSGFDRNMDLNDAVHFNLSGAIKVTRLIGDYLQNNYDFTDKRKDTSYTRYEKQKDLFKKQKDYISSKQALLSATSFYKYLTALSQIDLNENMIFLSVYGNAMNKLTDKECELLKKLGLQTNLQGKSGGNYAAVVSNEGIQESFSFIDTASLEGKIGAIPYEVLSEGIRSGQRSNILIDEKTVMFTGQGFNFVVYNTQLDSIVHSCFFNTAESVNPAQSRYKTTSANIIQHMAEPNVWENAE